MQQLKLNRSKHTLFVVVDTNCLIDCLDGVIGFRQVPTRAACPVLACS